MLDVKFEDDSTPSINFSHESVVGLIGQLELIAWKSVEAIEHLSKYLRVEPAILVEYALTQIYESIAICDGSQMHQGHKERRCCRPRHRFADGGWCES